MKTRKELPALFQEFYQTGIGAEIGTFRAEFSQLILKKWKGTLACIDSYSDSVTGMDMIGAKKEATNRLKGYRAIPFYEDSLVASKLFEDGSFDFVYIDASHRYEDVKDDIEAWTPKVRPGGIVSGHDYFDGLYEGVHFGVKSAVDEYVKNNNLILNTTNGDEAWMGYQFRSWWFVKE